MTAPAARGEQNRPLYVLEPCERPWQDATPGRQGDSRATDHTFGVMEWGD